MKKLLLVLLVCVVLYVWLTAHVHAIDTVGGLAQRGDVWAVFGIAAVVYMTVETARFFPAILEAITGKRQSGTASDEPESS